MTEQNASADTTRKWIGAVQDEWSMYSGNPNDYTVGAPIGFGASSIVYSAQFHPPRTQKAWPVALKVVDLDRLPPAALRLLTRETQLMSLSKHPNVLKVRGTWVQNRKLYIALRLMNSGSVSDVMRYKFPAGVEEEAARCILKQALEGLNYLHVNGLVHRDIKAANLLLDDDGTVLVGDLGVAASLSDEDAHNHAANIPLRRKVNGEAEPPLPKLSGGTLGKRKSFVGTPCWMAPEVIAQKQYDASADIWSLGITALELCNGRAPYSRDTPTKILQKILHNDAPTLDRKAGKYQYSREFKEIIENCLVKDPSQRPTAAELLETPFFKGSKRKGYLVSALIAGLPPLVDRQERRKHASILSNSTAGSWDFQSTINFTPTTSPTQSIFSQSASIGRAHVERRSAVPDQGIFEMEDHEARAETENRSGVRPSISHSRSSTKIPRVVSISEEPGVESDQDPHPKPRPTSDPDVVPEVVSKSFSSSSSSNPVDLVTPSSSSSNPAVPVTDQSGLSPSNKVSKSGSGLAATSSMWKKLTGKASKMKEGKEKEGFKTPSQHGGIVMALSERTSSRK